MFVFYVICFHTFNLPFIFRDSNLVAALIFLFQSHAVPENTFKIIFFNIQYFKFWYLFFPISNLIFILNPLLFSFSMIFPLTDTICIFLCFILTPRQCVIKSFSRLSSFQICSFCRQFRSFSY